MDDAHKEEDQSWEHCDARGEGEEESKEGLEGCAEEEPCWEGELVEEEGEGFG